MGFINAVREKFPDFEWRRMVKPGGCRQGAAAD
jgi:hypothetical protein